MQDSTRSPDMPQLVRNDRTQLLGREHHQQWKAKCHAERWRGPLPPATFDAYGCIALIVDPDLIDGWQPPRCCHGIQHRKQRMGIGSPHDRPWFHIGGFRPVPGQHAGDGTQMQQRKHGHGSQHDVGQRQACVPGPGQRQHSRQRQCRDRSQRQRQQNHARRARQHPTRSLTNPAE